MIILTEIHFQTVPVKMDTTKTKTKPARKLFVNHSVKPVIKKEFVLIVEMKI